MVVNPPRSWLLVLELSHANQIASLPISQSSANTSFLIVEEMKVAISNACAVLLIPGFLPRIFLDPGYEARVVLQDYHHHRFQVS